VQVILDRDVSRLYGVATGALNRQVKRNEERFPEDFMFRLSAEEWDNLKCQIGISSWGGDRQLPYAFTENGIAMLSSVLRSPTAIEVNIRIMRAGVKVTIFTSEHYDKNHVPRHKISDADIKTFNAQYPKLAVRYNESFHDRFLIIDDKEIYLIGASLKDLGSKCFAFTQLDPGAIRGIKKSAFTQPSVQRTRPVACAVGAATVQKARM
jgi:ORF6N domain.